MVNFLASEEIFDFKKDKKFDQFISEDENSKGVPGWIHIGYMRYDGVQRKEFKKMVNGIYYDI